jgi:hypothetical protein
MGSPVEGGAMSRIGLFVQDLNKFKNNVKNIAPKVVQDLTVEAKARVTKKNPVDTGFSRANWEIVPLAKGDFPANKVENKVHYILKLEQGHSKQAPFGMARLTGLELLEWIKRRPGLRETQRG